jgi:coenzyme F420-reducing hydrogenase delta subunit
VVACEEGNCHHIEGSLRCRRRLEFVDGLLEQIGVGKDRLMLFHLPGSAAEDMAVGAGEVARPDRCMDEKVAAIRDEIVARLRVTASNPLHQSILPEKALYEVDDQDESD